jgi:hypothetical protein
MRNVIPFIAFTVSIFLMIGCHRQPQGKIIARVGDVVLTDNEALTHIDTLRKPIDDQLKRYVVQWINNELVNQEANQRGIEKEDQFLRQAQEAEKILANQYFLEHYIYSDTTETKTVLLQEYFKNHSSEFLVQEDVVKLNIITFSTRERASSFAASVLRGVFWSDALSAALSDSTSGEISSFKEKYYTQHTLFPTELWKVASTLGINDVSFPVKTPIGYSVIHMISVIKKGEPADFTFVQDEIRGRVLIEQRRKRYNELLENLRNKFKVDIFLNTSINSDSNKVVNHE